MFFNLLLLLLQLALFSFFFLLRQHEKKTISKKRDRQETSAAVLSWSAALLAHHPEAQRRALEEIDSVFPSSSSSPRPLSPGDAGKLPFLECVLLESMRLLPPAYIVGRHAANGARLSRRRRKGPRAGRGGREKEMDEENASSSSSSSLDFWELPPKTSVLVSPYLLHRDSASWEHPRRFLPERWLPLLLSQGEGGADKPRSSPGGGSGPGGLRSMPLLAGLGPNGAYVPFGAGPRVCVGASFAMLEGVIVLAALLRVAGLRPLEGVTEEEQAPRFPAAEPRLTLRPSGAGVKLLLVPRDRAE